MISFYHDNTFSCVFLGREKGVCVLVGSFVDIQERLISNVTFLYNDYDVLEQQTPIECRADSTI